MRHFLAGVLVLAAAGASRADAPSSGGDPSESSRADFSIVVVHDLAALTPEKALQLNGKRAVFRIEIIPCPAGGRMCPAASCPNPWCRCADGALSYVELGKDVHASSGMTVEATLNVLHYAAGAGGFPEGYYFILSGAVKLGYMHYNPVNCVYVDDPYTGAIPAPTTTRDCGVSWT